MDQVVTHSTRTNFKSFEAIEAQTIVLIEGAIIRVPPATILRAGILSITTPAEIEGRTFLATQIHDCTAETYRAFRRAFELVIQSAEQHISGDERRETFSCPITETLRGGLHRTLKDGESPVLQYFLESTEDTRMLTATFDHLQRIRAISSELKEATGA